MSKNIFGAPGRKDLERATDLCEAFREALESRYGDDETLKKRALANLSTRERKDFVARIQAVANEGLRYAFGAVPGKEFLKKNLSVADTTARQFLGVLPRETLAACVPDRFKTEKDARLLRRLKAPHLAKLCKP